MNLQGLAFLYRSDGDSSEDDDEQEIPAWAKDANLRKEIQGQQKLDPDELFQQHEKTCPLDEVFASLRSGASHSTAKAHNLPNHCCSLKNGGSP